MVQYTVVEIKKQNRITIPESVREAEGIKEKDLIKITVEKINKK